MTSSYRYPHGTHRGEFEGMTPTNKLVKIRSADLYRIENGKIVEHWDVVDRLDLLKQTGAITFKDHRQQSRKQLLYFQALM